MSARSAGRRRSRRPFYRAARVGLCCLPILAPRKIRGSLSGPAAGTWPVTPNYCPHGTGWRRLGGLRRSYGSSRVRSESRPGHSTKREQQEPAGARCDRPALLPTRGASSLRDVAISRRRVRFFLRHTSRPARQATRHRSVATDLRRGSWSRPSRNPYRRCGRMTNSPTRPRSGASP